MPKPTRPLAAFAALAACLLSTAHAAGIVSDGSDGPFNGAGSLALDSDGVFNFTTVNVTGTLSFIRNATNTPVVIAATGDVTIAAGALINVSASHFSGVGGPGGGDGGAFGRGAQAGLGGEGPSPGEGGPFPAGSTNPGNAGGGAGNATSGLQASGLTNSMPGAAGGGAAFNGAIAGSSGGGGSGWILFGVDLDGGVGGGGGLLVTTPGTITLDGAIAADGGHAGWAFANVFGYGGGGGGGSAGNVWLDAGAIVIGPEASISVRGGAGGGISTQPVANDPWTYTNGAHGGDGYVALSAGSVSIDPGATIGGTVVPVPASLPLLAAALGAGLAVVRRRGAGV